MVVYYDKDSHIEAGVTPKMLRQMREWDKAGIANVSLIGLPTGAKEPLIIHVSRVHVDLSIVRHESRR